MQRNGIIQNQKIDTVRVLAAYGIFGRRFQGGRSRRNKQRYAVIRAGGGIQSL